MKQHREDDVFELDLAIHEHIVGWTMDSFKGPVLTTKEIIETQKRLNILPYIPYYSSDFEDCKLVIEAMHKLEFCMQIIWNQNFVKVVFSQDKDFPEWLFFKEGNSLDKTICEAALFAVESSNLCIQYV